MINLELQKRLPDFQFITVNFEGSTVNYTYKTCIPGIEPGDLLVVPTVNGLTVVTVSATNVKVAASPKFAIKWVVQVVYPIDYKECVKFEKELDQELRAKQTTGVNRL